MKKIKMIMVVCVMFMSQNVMANGFDLLFQFPVAQPSDGYEYSYEKGKHDGAGGIVADGIVYDETKTELAGLTFGASYTFDQYQIEGSYTLAEGGKYTLNTMGFVRADNFRFGIGATSHRNIEYEYTTQNKVTDNVGNILQHEEKSTIHCDDAIGAMVQIDYIIEQPTDDYYMTIGIRYTDITFKYAGGEINGNNAALIFSVYF